MDKHISVIIPVKNGTNYIQEAIDGIKRQNMDVEIIVVDDCSTDETVHVAEAAGCKVVKHDVPKGQVAGKNTGLKVASGDYIMFHDHDDVMNDGALKLMCETLENNPDVSLVMCKVKDFLSPDCTNKESALKEEPYYGLFTGAVLIRREVFDKVGLFDESLATGEIISLQTKLQAMGLSTMKIDFVSTQRRIHDTNFGITNRKREYQDYFSVLRSRLKNK